MDNALQAKTALLLFFSTLLALACFGSQSGAIVFDSPRWTLINARTVDHLGQKALMGTALLNDADFGDGVIEFDLAVNGARSYPGILFRTRSDGSWERFYLRPHRSGCLPSSLYADAVQYVASFNRVDSWQFYNGEGLTAGAAIPRDRWFHVKVEVSGDQARIFLDQAEKPALQVDHLKHGPRRGGLGLLGPLDGSAYFANFSYRAADDLAFAPPPLSFPVPGALTVWELSRPLKALQIDMEKTPDQQGLADLAWQAISAEADGLVDVSRFHQRSGEPDLVFARTTLFCEEDRTFKLNLGYSDYVSVFLNGRLLYNAASPYQGRDPSFLGIVGLFDTLYLPLQKGDNVLLLAVAEVSGGWGFKAQDGNALAAAPGVKRAWQTPKAFLTPESAAYDPKTRALYVSNFAAASPGPSSGAQSISKLDLEGAIAKLDWVTGLTNPAGVAIYQNKLLVAERSALAEIDIANARISRRFEIPGALALNDIVVAPKGVVYISDPGRNAIFRFSRGRSAIWLSGPEVSRPNGLAVAGNRLFWGNNGDGKLKSANLSGGEIRTVAALGRGIIDGVLAEASGSILVSHNEGRLMRVSRDGGVTLLLDTTAIGQNLADFTLIPGRDLIVFPTWLDGRVTAFSLGQAE